MPPDTFASPVAAPPVMAVVVVYELSLDRVEAWPALLACLAGHGAPPDHAFRLAHLLIYDNSTSPRAQPPAAIERCSYVHDSRNGGTAAAYHAASERAAALGIEWLLLLDHDTRLPESYFRAAGWALAGVPAQVAALLPSVRHADTPISPAVITPAGSMKPVMGAAAALAEGTTSLTGIASGALVRVSALRSIVPFPPDLWLDYVDHWMFTRFVRPGLQIRLLDATVQHDLSVANPALLSEARLASILAGERLFLQQLGWLARCVHPLRLLLRVARLWNSNRARARQVMAFLLHRG